MLFGSSRPRLGAGIVATPEQEAETARLEAMMQRPMPMGGVTPQPAPQQPQMGWGEKVGGIGAALMAAQAAIDGDFVGGAKIAGSIGADRREALQKMQLAQQQRVQERDDWKWKQDYQAANPGPINDQFQQRMKAAGIDPASPQGQALLRQKVTTDAMPPPNFVGDGMGGGRWVQPPAPAIGGMAAAPQAASSGPQPGMIEDGYQFVGGNPADPNSWKPVGGGGGNVTGGFPNSIPSGNPLEPYRR